MLTAITRQVPPSIVHCQLTHIPRERIDHGRAVHQHRGYEDALTGLGCQLVSLEAESELPDSTFVEDTAVILDEFAILARPAPESRRGEVARIAPTLREFRELRSIEAPGTLEGGDVLSIGRQIYVGHSGRTNGAGIEQLDTLLRPAGYTVTPIEIRRCLHLKSAVTQVGPDALLMNPHWVDPTEFKGLHSLDIDPSEPYAANGLLVEGSLIYPRSFPRTAERLTARNVRLELVDVSELQKAEGAVTCCCLLFEDPI